MPFEFLHSRKSHSEPGESAGSPRGGLYTGARLPANIVTENSPPIPNGWDEASILGSIVLVESDPAASVIQGVDDVAFPQSESISGLKSHNSASGGSYSLAWSQDTLATNNLTAFMGITNGVNSYGSTGLLTTAVIMQVNFSTLKLHLFYNGVDQGEVSIAAGIYSPIARATVANNLNQQWQITTDFSSW